MAPPVYHPMRSASLLFALVTSLFWGATSAALPRPLFKAAAIGSTPDTLEVFVLYVQFKSELLDGDVTSTTGKGTFGTDPKDTATLDPNTAGTARTYRYYLEKHFEFARNYYDKVSNGRVVILPRIFPPPEGSGRIRPLNLSKRMSAYNPVQSQKQKTSDFDAQHAQALMTFVGETVSLFDTVPDGGFPFKTAYAEGKLNPSPHHHRAFMIFHAGYSRLVDGGTLGPAGANTPNDFTDFFVTKPDFHFLDSATTTNLPGGKASPLRKDSLGVIVSTGDSSHSSDTLSQFMMLSESANQDGVNWGINGILVNQLGRQMGMPDLFDVVQGISQIGFFDVMDFAGYNTLNGFLPVFPSAWTRAFMGWDDPVEVPRSALPYTETPLYAADQPGPGRVRTLKVPLNDREYLLIENRQRAARADSVTISYAKPSNPTDVTFGATGSIKVPFASIDSLFLDSLCKDGPACKVKQVNTHKPKGIITGSSHYDLGLPGNGLLVWHVNEWFIETFLKAGFVNAYLGDTLRSQYKGLELVEADGIPSIGKQFTDPLGQPSFDYGTGEDMLPHVFRKRKNPPKDTTWAAPETLSVIGSYGFANTNSWNDGRTHIKLQAQLPASPKFAKNIGGFTGDSVFTLRDSVLALRVYWPNDSSIARPSGSFWPVRTAAAGNPQAVNVLRSANGSGPYVISAADTGMLQTYTSGGTPALAARYTRRNPAGYDSVLSALSTGNTRPADTALVNSIVDTAGKPIGVCVAGDSVLAVLTPRFLRLVHPNADSLNGSARSGGRADSISVAGVVGPMAWNGKIFIIDSQSVLRGYALNGAHTDSVQLPSRAYHSMAGLRFEGNLQIVVAGAKGAALRVDLVAHTYTDLKPAWTDSLSADEFFSVLTSDFDRDSSDDIFLLGSKGAALLFHARADKQGRAFAGFPQHFPRSIQLQLDSAGHAYTDTTGHTYLTEDRSSPAIADLNADGHPDIVFSGTDAVYAVDWHGAFLPGWPFRPHLRQSVGFTYATHRFPPTVIGSTPLVISLRQNPTVLLGSPDGLIYAVDNAGKPLNYSSYTESQKSSTGVLMSNQSDWPLSVGGLSLDSLRSPYIHLSLARIDSTTTDLQLMAQSASGSLSAWSLRSSQAKPGQNWLMPGGDAGRTFHFEASTLGAVQTSPNLESIQEFHLFPSPVRHGFATVHLKIGAAASTARVRVFNITGHAVVDQTFADLTPGLQPFNHVLDMSRLGPDVYSVLCEVSFADGSKSSKWERIGVIK